jgi:hypothetical protein
MDVVLQPHHHPVHRIDAGQSRWRQHGTHGKVGAHFMFWTGCEPIALRRPWMRLAMPHEINEEPFMPRVPRRAQWPIQLVPPMGRAVRAAPRRP